MSLRERMKRAVQAFTQKDENKVKGIISMDSKGWKWQHAYLEVRLPEGYTIDEKYWSYKARQSFPYCYMSGNATLKVSVKKYIEKENK